VADGPRGADGHPVRPQVRSALGDAAGRDGLRLRDQGRKRHIAVDADRRLPMVNLTPADGQNAAGAECIINAIRKRWPWLKHLFVDGTSDRGRLTSAAAYRDFIVEIVRGLPDKQGFQILPRRWVVERAFGWMIRWRRLVQDDGRRLDVSEAMIRISVGALLLKTRRPPVNILKRALRPVRPATIVCGFP